MFASGATLFAWSNTRITAKSNSSKLFATHIYGKQNSLFNCEKCSDEKCWTKTIFRTSNFHLRKHTNFIVVVTDAKSIVRERPEVLKISLATELLTFFAKCVEIKTQCTLKPLSTCKQISVERIFFC